MHKLKDDIDAENPDRSGMKENLLCLELCTASQN